MNWQRRSPVLALLFSFLLLLMPVVLLAQDRITVTVNGEPRLVDGQVEAFVSVNTVGGAVVNIPPDSFIVKEDNRQVPLEELRIEPVAAGIGLVILVDRGGIAAQNGCQGPTGQLRIGEVKTMTTDLVNSLVIQVEGAADDMAAVVGIGDEDSSGTVVFSPDVNFSYNPVDRNLALNELESLDAAENLLPNQTITTPLYEGLYRALNLLAENSDPTLRAALATRQNMIIVFSDGIDQDYSDDVVESDILRIASVNNVIIHTMGMACRDGSRLVENTLRRLATNSRGFYWRHGSMEEHVMAVAGLQNLLTYRQQYVVRFPSRLSSGTHRLSVQVVTERGADEDSVDFVSALQKPTFSLMGPANGYSLSEDDATATTLPVTATVEFGDGVSRDVLVQFAVNGTAVFTTTTPPYRYDWDLSGMGIGDHVLRVTATDSQLGESWQEERTIRITAVPTPTPEPVIPGPTPSATGNLAIWAIPVLVALVILLFILLYQTRSGFKQTVVAGVRNVRSATVKLTQKLGPPQPTLAKLIVARGPNHGEEYRLTEEVTRFGREADRCDKIIPGAYVSSLHFSIMYNAQQRIFYVMDHRSTNGTYLNRQLLPPETYQHLPFGSTISIGQNHEVELLFQPVMRTTRVLGSPNP